MTPKRRKVRVLEHTPQIPLDLAAQRLPLGGVPARHLYRREAPMTSVAAAHAVDTTKGEQRVLDVVRSFGERGGIQDDVLKALPNAAYSSVTARFSGLLDKGYIIDTGKTAEGKSGRQQRIVRAVV